MAVRSEIVYEMQKLYIATILVQKRVVNLDLSMYCNTLLQGVVNNYGGGGWRAV